MNFGVPSQRKQRVEKYPDTPVLTLQAFDGSKGKGRKIELNTAACDALNLDQKDARIAFSFDANGFSVCNGEQPGVPKEHTIRVTKSYPRTISDKKTYEYIIKTQGLDETVDNEYTLTKTDVDGIIVFSALAGVRALAPADPLPHYPAEENNEQDSPNQVPESELTATMADVDFN